MNQLDEAIALLEAERARNDTLLVSYSGGKDSRVVLDLASRVFAPGKVQCFFMYFLPGLECVREGLDFAVRRYGVEIIQLPHWLTSRCLKREVFCDTPRALDGMNEWTVADVRAVARKRTGIPTIATGEKRADSRIRATFLPAEPGIVRPLFHWNKFDLLSCMKARALPQPDQDARGSGGVDLSAKSLLFLHDHYPHDFDAIEAVFPYVRAVVKRREFHGIPKV